MPLAHILAPQIAQKVNQMEADLNRAGYHNAGYLQSTGNVDSRSAVQGGRGMPLPKMRPGETASDAALRELRAQEAERKKNPKTLDTLVREGMLKGARKAEAERQNLHRGPYIAPAQPTPAPRPAAKPGVLTFAPGEVIGQTEGGMPITAPKAAPKTDKRGRQIITLPKDMQAINEYGEPVDKKGKKLKTGYLNQDPMLRFPTNDPMNPYETGGAKMIERFPGKESIIERRYRSHLEAMQNNRDEQGMPTDKLPPGYFEALGRERGRAYTKDERQDVLNGIEALRKIEKGVSI